jgi:hypothetical protein
VALLLLALLFMAGVLAGRAARRYHLRHRGPDPALRIVPPRPYVDADGQSQFRPEWCQNRALSKPADVVDAALQLRTEKR